MEIGEFLNPISTSANAVRRGKKSPASPSRIEVRWSDQAVEHDVNRPRNPAALDRHEEFIHQLVFRARDPATFASAATRPFGRVVPARRTWPRQG